MNRSQMRIITVAAIAVVSVSLAGATFPSAIGAQTSSVSSGVFVDENTTLEDPPGPSGLNLSDTPWLQAYYQFFEPRTENETVASADGSDPDTGVDLLPILAAVGSAVTVLTGVGAVVWLRWLWSTPEGFGEQQPLDAETEPTTTDEPVPPGELDPSNEVYRAWCELVGQLSVTRPEVMTPRELARSAIQQGFDREAVESLTRAFEEVRYGEPSPTGNHESRATAALDRLTGGDEP